MKNSIRIFIYLSFWFVAIPMYAQQLDYEIKTDKESYRGDTMWVKKDSLCISKNGMVNCFIIDDVVNYFVPKHRSKIFTYDQHPFNTFGIYALTAFTQKKGKFVYRNFTFLDQNMEYGVTNNVSIQFGNAYFTSNSSRTLFSPQFGVKGSLSIIKNKITVGSRIRYRRSTPTILNNWSYRCVNTLTYSALLTLGGQYNYLNFVYTIDYFESIGTISNLSIGAKCRLDYRTSMLLDVSTYNEKYNGISFGIRRDFRRNSIIYGFFASESTNRIPIPYFCVQIQW